LPFPLRRQAQYQHSVSMQASAFLLHVSIRPGGIHRALVKG